MKDDIIKLAREAGLETYLAPHWDLYEELERFYQLAVAAEREKVAAWMIDRSYATGHGDTIEDLLKELEWQVAERERERIIAANAPEIERINKHIKTLENAVTDEREACAKVCEARYMGDNTREDMEARRCAAAIRARGNT